MPRLTRRPDERPQRRYWTTTTLVALAFVTAGVVYLLRADAVAQMWKVLGGLAGLRRHRIQPHRGGVGLGALAKAGT